MVILLAPPPELATAARPLDLDAYENLAKKWLDMCTLEHV